MKKLLYKPVGLLAGLAVWILVSYFVGPHVYCET